MVHDPPAATDHGTSGVASIAEMGLGRPVQTQLQLGKSAPWVAIIEVEEIVRELAQPPQVVPMVIRRADEFEILEEEEASAETMRLRADLSVMVNQIEVDL